MKNNIRHYPTLTVEKFSGLKVKQQLISGKYAQPALSNKNQGLHTSSPCGSGFADGGVNHYIGNILFNPIFKLFGILPVGKRNSQPVRCWNYNLVFTGLPLNGGNQRKVYSVPSLEGADLRTDVSPDSEQTEPAKP